MNEPYRAHPTEDALERFILRTSSEAELELVETHILACEHCVEQLEALETNILAAKVALQEFESERMQEVPAKPNKRWKSWFTVPKLSLATAGAFVAIGAMFFLTPSDVALTAYRGADAAKVSEGRPLHILLNANGLNGGPVTIELVNSEGESLWRGPSTVRRGVAEATIPRITSAGEHFLRIYSQDELLREFKVTAHWSIF